MESVKLILLVFSVASAFLMVKGQTVCQSTFLTNLNYCLGNRSISLDNFLFLTRDGKAGKVADDPVVFLTKLCSVRTPLSSCVRGVVDNMQLLPDTTCNSTQKASIFNLYKSLFKVVNQKCQNPCRSTFKESLTKCYNDFNFKLSDYMLFSPTVARDYILGTNKTEVQRFCDNRTAIVQCLHKAVTTCEDGPFLLDSYTLDLDSLNETYTVLCNYTDIYMEAVKCYEFPVNPVLTCRSTLYSRVNVLNAQLDELNTTETQYKDELCRARLDQVQCESEFVKPDNETTKCNTVVIGLHKQQECLLLPRSCRSSSQPRINTMCREADFLIPERVTFTLALTSAGHTPVSVHFLLLTLITTFLASLV
ncbi:hypothetical protein Btru_030308 [Bulinus truncatus]|nr:hypothetical protein Btru_030308 [Bulinus truncatus]